ncbi:MAG: signal peptidase I [Actinomycetota bacterium]|nr:signal peptidase I [Actinomycetota bacterium]
MTPTRGGARGWIARLTELPLLVLLALLVAVTIKTFLVQAFYIPSSSMLPTLHVGDRVLVEKLSYRLHSPKRDDVVVFERSVFAAAPDLPWYRDAENVVREILGLPVGGSEDYIKRVIGVAGDAIRYVGRPRRLYVNGRRVAEPFLGRDSGSPTLTGSDCKRLKMRRGREGCVVPPDEVFVMGDNRGNSEDSRVLGPIGVARIVGHAVVIVWPPSHFGTL